MAMMKITMTLLLIVTSLAAVQSERLVADAEYNLALRRAKYLLNGSMPTDDDYASSAQSLETYRAAVRSYIDGDAFYDSLMRYHQRLFGVGLHLEYLEELQNDDIDNKANKFARINCSHSGGKNNRYRCYWSSNDVNGGSDSGCPEAWEQPASVFWYPGLAAWVCPSVLQGCGSDLSRCFITYEDENVAKNSELGATEIFDSRYAVMNSLSRQAAGLATEIVMENYPYTYILEPGVSAMDGAIAHFYRQPHHFKIADLHLDPELVSAANKMALTDTKFRLTKTANTDYASAGVLSTFGWLRRYEKNRTRANQLYERFLCRKFTSELPRVFPQDPGNLRETDGCKGCHSTLDPLADFFAAWGEGGELYVGQNHTIDSYFNNKTGSTLADLANIVRNDQAFATCSVENAWEWLMGRGFYTDEDTLRAGFTSYFIRTNYSFKELVYAMATHPAFMEGTRSDALVTDPLEEPPLGQSPGEVEQPCPSSAIVFANDIQPSISMCTACHNASSSTRQDLSTEAAWRNWANQAVGMMASGQMPPGQFGPTILDFKETVRCWAKQEGL